MSCLFRLFAVLAVLFAAPAFAQVSPCVTVPPQAAAVGYTTLTFGPTSTLGTNWFPMSFLGETGAQGASQSGANILISGAGGGFNANISTAANGTTPTNWTGTAFGGGAYFEATLSFTGQSYGLGGDQVAFWANDVENMATDSTTGLPVHWAGQATNYGHWVETDFAIWNASAAFQYGGTIFDWYGVVGSGDEINAGSVSGSPWTLSSSVNFTASHKYGWLWIPATASVQGSASFWFDGAQVGNTIHWNQYNPATAPPPVLGGSSPATSAFSVLDSRHLALLLGTSQTSNPLTVYGVSVWQASNANNLINGAAP